MTNNKNEGTNVKGMIAVTAGVLAAAAAGTYFLYGSKNAKKYRGQIKSWMFKAKAEILEKLEKLEVVTEDEYNNIVEAVLAKYKDVKGMDMADMKKMVGDLKGQWKAIKKQITPKKKKAATKAKTSAKAK